MAKYICSVCGYVYDEAENGAWEALPAHWSCPLCGAGKDAFGKQTAQAQETVVQPVPQVERELSPMEMSVICSNLARGCEKQYLTGEAADFRRLADFFRAEAAPAEAGDTAALLALIEQDLSVGYPYGNAAARAEADRGALRCQVWSEKVTRMLRSLLTRYQAEGERMLENTGVWVCTICGFVSVGDVPPEQCPVCKVPAWKFEKVEGRDL